MTLLRYSDIADRIPDHGGKLVLGYSGGVDSLVLLHLCASQANLKHKMLAVYIHHGLQAAADDWEHHCALQAGRLGVAFRSIRVDARPSNGESPEAAARRARYAALRPLLETGDALLLAQHREDQMETLLLQLFRGAGVQGLAAMAAAMPFGRGVLLRPLLNIGKSEILSYARHHELEWVDDPSNLSSDFDRNFLRNQVVPLLKQRWPALDKTVARAAQHCGEALHLLQAWSGQQLQTLGESDDRSLRLDRLAGYNAEQRRWLLRDWLAGFGIRPPSQSVLRAIESRLIAARDGAVAHIELQDHSLRKYRHHLYCLSPQALLPLPCDYAWRNGDSSAEPGNGYRARCVAAETGIPQALWHRAERTLRPRRGGEKLKLPGRSGHHALKKLYQEAGIPPWERQCRPLLYLDGRLAAVPGLWVDEWAWSAQNEACYRLIWEYADSGIDTTP